MLGKLLRYDFRSVGKQFSALWIAVLVVALVNRLLGSAVSRLDFGALSNWLEGSVEFFLRVMPAMVYFAMMVALMVISLIYVVQWFYSGLLGGEGYLVHMLPVKTWQLIFSKLVTATVVILGSGVVGILSIAILGADWSFFRDLVDVFPRLGDISFILIALQFVLLLLFSLWSWITQVYTACAFGQLSNKNRALLSVVAYVVLNIVQSTLFFCLLFGVGIAEEATGFLTSWMEGLVRAFQLERLSGEGAFHLVMTCVNLFFLAKSAVFFLVTEYLLRRKLNLQ